MTAIAPNTTGRKLGLVIDLDTCVGCHACAVACKEWNDGGHMAPLTDEDPYGKEPFGVWFNRVHAFETQPESGCSGGPATTRTVHFPAPACTASNRIASPCARPAPRTSEPRTASC